MARPVRRYSRSARVVTEVQPSYTPPANATKEMFDTAKQGFEAGKKFLRPAVELEQTQRGEREAIEAFEGEEFEMRSPFSIRDAAFNATGERLVTNRAMIDLDEAFRGALKRADGSIRRLEAELSEVEAGMGGLPEIPGLRTRWIETFERGAVTARRQTTELAQRRAAAAARQAAQDAAAAAENEVARLALTAGSPEELAAAISTGQADLAQYGPRGEFTVGGVTYPADPSRQGIYTPRQLETMNTALEREAHELFLRADYERTDSPAQWAEEFERTVLAGESPLPPGQALDMLSRFQSAARSDENARRTQENRVEAQLRDAADNALSPYVTARDNGLMVAMPDEERQALRSSVAGNATVAADLERHFAAADAIVAMNGLNPSQRIEYIEDLNRQFLETPGISPDEAAVVNAVAPYLEAARSAITRETVGVSAAEQMLTSGSVPTPEQLADMRTRAGGNPRLLQSVGVLEEAVAMVEAGNTLSGVEREEWLNTLGSELAELGVEGGRVGAGAQRRVEALEIAQQHFDTIEEMAQKDVTRFAVAQGIALSPMPTEDTAQLPDVAMTIAARVGEVRDATAQFGNEYPVPLSSSEMEAISDWMGNTNNASRIGFMEALDQSLPPAQSEAILNALGVDNPALLAAGRLVSSNPAASRAVLAGIGANVRGVTETNMADAELTIQPLLPMLAPAELGRVRQTAEAYARGMAVRRGDSEIKVSDIEEGLDMALGADEDGNGGIEDAGRFGVTIMPTGVSGSDVESALRNMSDDRLTELVGGPVRDIMDREMTARDLFGGFTAGAVSGLRPLPGGLYAPLDDNGGFFITDNGPLTFSMEDLLGG